MTRITQYLNCSLVACVFFLVQLKLLYAFELVDYYTGCMQLLHILPTIILTLKHDLLLVNVNSYLARVRKLVDLSG